MPINHLPLVQLLNARRFELLRRVLLRLGVVVPGKSVVLAFRIFQCPRNRDRFNANCQRDRATKKLDDDDDGGGGGDAT